MVETSTNEHLNKLDAITAMLDKMDPSDAWSAAVHGILDRSDGFELHLQVYEACYGHGSFSPGPAWIPSQAVIEHANITAACRELGLHNCRHMHTWSVENREKYWQYAIGCLGVKLQDPCRNILDNSVPETPVWLAGAAMNIVESCFNGDPDSPAIISSSDDGSLHITTYAELKKLTGRMANGLIIHGIKPGDAVAIVMPMSPLAVAMYLAIIACGAAVVSIAESFAPAEIATRLELAGTRMVFTQDYMLRAGKRLALYEKVVAAGAPTTVVAGYDQEGPAELCRPDDVRWTDLLSDDESLPLAIRSPQDPVNILFSSGTTGEPKAIPWDHTTPIKCAADAHFHQDVHPGDVVCWPTSLGWMMGPWLVFAALLNRATIALSAHAPTEPPFGKFVLDARVTMLGVVPSLVRAWRTTAYMEVWDWSGIRAFSSSGECSNYADVLYLMYLAGYRPVIEYCGGTEIGGAYITGTVVQPCTPTEFTTPAFGIDFATFDDGQHSEVGEVFLNGPSIGLSTRLLKGDHSAVYYRDLPPQEGRYTWRRHGDEVQKLPTGNYRIMGRVDDTMNLGGIKVSCAEIERVLNRLDGVQETAAVAAPQPGGGPSRLIVFAVLRPGADAPISEADLKRAMQQTIRTELNPLFHVSDVKLLPALPRNASNKVMRRELRSLETHIWKSI